MDSAKELQQKILQEMKARSDSFAAAYEAIDSDEEDGDDVVPDYAKCNVCRELLYRPVSYPCGHTFCYNCCVPDACPECRGKLCVLAGYASLGVNHKLETVLQAQFPDKYMERKKSSEEFSNIQKIADWIPKSYLYSQVYMIITKWYETNLKASYFDCLASIDTSLTESFTVPHYLWYYAWLNYIKANFGETKVPVAVFSHNDMNHNDKREVDLNQYARMFNRCQNTVYIKYITDEGLEMEDYHINPDMNFLLISFAKANLGLLKTLYENHVTPTLVNDQDRPLVINLPMENMDSQSELAQAAGQLLRSFVLTNQNFFVDLPPRTL